MALAAALLLTADTPAPGSDRTGQPDARLKTARCEWVKIRAFDDRTQFRCVWKGPVRLFCLPASYPQREQVVEMAMEARRGNRAFFITYFEDVSTNGSSCDDPASRRVYGVELD